jgi:hypothetical protein
MKSTLAMAALAALIAGSAVVPGPASARSPGYDRYHKAHRHDGRHYRHRCDGGDGAVGTIVGGAGGALIGDALGGGTLGTVAGGVGGALVGRHLDKQNTKSRHGC